MRFVTNVDTSRLPELDDDLRVPAADCRVVKVTLMLPAGTSNDDVESLLERFYASEPTVLHWSTNLAARP